MHGLTGRAGIPILLTLLAGRAMPPSAAQAEPRGDDAIASGLGDLHQGLYAHAEASFRAAAAAAPGDPGPLLFSAYGFYWRILEDPKSEEFDEAFDTAAGACLAAAEHRLETVPRDAGAAAAAGMTHILRSHVEALRRSYFHAGQEARRGKRLLEDALDADPGLTDALFPLGTYNYFADKVPAVVKGLRALLFLPGGDADLGLEQLRAVARSSARFHTDARMVLAAICGSREERCYPEAIAQLRTALDDNPGSPIILGWLGGVETRLGLYEEAARYFESALRAASGADPDRLRQRRRLGIFLAEALAGGWRLGEAESVLRGVKQEPGPLPDSDRRMLGRVEAEIAAKRGGAGSKAAADPEDRDGAARAGAPVADPLPGAAAPALGAVLRLQEEGRASEALAAFRTIAASEPGLALPRFLLGRSLFLAGRYAESEAELEKALDLTEDPPAWMEGWGELYRGLALQKLGEPRKARSHFHRASDVKRFRAAERGLLEMRGDEPSRAECTP